MCMRRRTKFGCSLLHKLVSLSKLRYLHWRSGSSRYERKGSFVESMPAAEAVEALILEYGKLVFHTIYGLTGDWEESQDLTQETFHQALGSIDAAPPKSGSKFRAKA